MKAVIFDMDGVIVDSEPLHVEAEKQTLAPFGVKVETKELQAYMGRHTKEFLKDFITKLNLKTKVDKIYPKHKNNLLKLYRENVRPIPGALLLIGDMKAAGVDVAVASSSDRELIDLVIDKFHLHRFFRTVVSGEEIGQTKPYPEIFLEAARRLGYDPKDCVVIEDSQAGVQAAKAAGMVCIGFRSPNSHNQDLSEADLIINDLREIDFQRLSELMANEI